MLRHVKRFLERLVGASDLSQHHKEIDELAARKDISGLIEIAKSARRACLLKNEWIYDSVLKKVEDTLAQTPGIEFARAACALAPLNEADPKYGIPRVWTLAGMLAAAQPFDVYTQIAVDPKVDLELLACWTYERVARFDDVANCREALAIQERLRTAGHKLAILPLKRLSIEKRIATWLPRYHGCGSSMAMASDSMQEEIQIEKHEIVEFGIQENVESNRIGAATFHWIEKSNGTVETRVFSVSTNALKAGDIAALLPKLDLLSLKGAQKIDAHEITALRAFDILFSAASQGGAYPGELLGAYGRYAAFESLAGLLKLTALDPAAIADAAQRATWISFDADSHWFNHVAWDLGIAAFSAEKRHLAILAATDTD